MMHGVAIDAGSGLGALIGKARGSRAEPDDLLTFKRAVLTTLGQQASTILIDAVFGPELIKEYPENCTPVMAYEADVYRISEPGRMTVLPDKLSVSDFARLGFKELKFFTYYAPNDDPELNKRKQDQVAKIGEQCARQGLRFLMEPLVFERNLAPGTPEYARLKPELVQRATEIFAAPRFRANVLKVEIPLDLAFVAGFGQPLFSRDQALDAFRAAAEASGDTEMVYLSAGVTFDMFEASLQMAREAEVDFSGFMCGRAIWADGVNIFGRNSEKALCAWLEDVGRKRLQRLIASI